MTVSVIQTIPEIRFGKKSSFITMSMATAAAAATAGDLAAFWRWQELSF